MNTFHRRVLTALSCSALLCALPTAQAQVLQGQEITESALVNALKSPEPLPAGVRTRSIRIGPADDAAAAPAKPRSKDVLITFETNSAELSHEGRAALDVVARAFQNEQLSTLNFAIEGHADPRGNADDNLRLSQARADSVLAYLVRVRGVSAERLRSVGKGDRELLNPRVPTAPENRRVTFVVTP